MTTPVVELRGVARHYPTPQGSFAALHHVGLSVNKGDFLVVTGPSGSGKSTLLHLLALLDRPTAGQVLFEGQDMSTAEESTRCRLRSRRIGMVFQRFCLLPHRTARENILFRFRYTGHSATAAGVLTDEALRRLGLAPIADRPARLLSAGEMQRVAVARALALRPDLLLADEPTGNLDRVNAMVVLELFRAAHAEGVPVVLVTHNEELLRYGTRHLICKDGALQPPEN